MDLVWKVINETLKRVGMPPVYPHLVQVSQMCVLLALKRGEDAPLAAIAGALHDVASLRSQDVAPYKIEGLTPNNHAEIGAAVAADILTGLNIVPPSEQEKICTAIRLHGNKNIVDSPFDEVLKDADIFAHGLGFYFRGPR